MTGEIIFIYNANSGLINGFLDTIHKIVSPATYSCKLCALTYDFAGMRSSWKVFLGSLNYETIFLHKDEFKTKYPMAHVQLPAVLISLNGNLQTLISKIELEQLMNEKQLADLINQKLKEFNPGQPSIS